MFPKLHADPDYPNNTITPAGHLEAKALARRMKDVIRPDKIYSSPLGRAVDTMKYTAEAMKATWTIEPWTAEMSDCRLTLEPWGEMVMWDVPGEIIRERAPYATHENWHEGACFTKPLLKERFEELKRNADAFLARHGYEREGGRYRVLRPNREKIAVFCHGGFGLCWLAHLLAVPLPLMWAGFFLPPSSVTTVLFDERSKQYAVPRCIGTGDLSHLYAAGLAMSPSGIKANVD